MSCQHNIHRVSLFSFIVTVLLTFLALPNEGLRDDCPQCVDNSANRFQASTNSNPNQFQSHRTSSVRMTIPQYRPIIAAYHPR